MSSNGHRALGVGCHGGVGRALLAVLEHTEPGRQLRSSLGELLLADREPPDRDAPADFLVLDAASPFEVDLFRSTKRGRR